VRGGRRCRLHGGLSTGPRTPEGLERSRRARWKHGAYSRERHEEYQRIKAECRAFNEEQRAFHAELFRNIRAVIRLRAAERRRQKRAR